MFVSLFNPTIKHLGGEKMKLTLPFHRFAGLLAIVVILGFVLAACSSGTPASSDSEKVPKPSNPGGTGPAVSLTGDATKGADVFKANCVQCHGDQGKVPVDNPGSTDGTVPSLNPIDEALNNADAKTFAANIDLFIEHGSTPQGSGPALKMTAFGDTKALSDQDIADVIAYVISLNKK
jgi:mono/diheme cytochrome c family protein